MSVTPEPKDKLGTMVRQRAATVVRRAVVVNGPEDVGLKWDAVNWRSAEQDVRRLRQRIFTASQVGDLKRVRNLQKLMLRSRSNTLVSVRRVAERNAGRLTAGIDGERALTSSAKATLTVDVHRERSSWQARPVRRIYIPKANGKQRPLGIPVLRDRALQACVVNALEPEWEARFEPRSYGFRPGRGCHDAIEAIYWTLNGRNAKRQWILDADLTAAFDRIDHDHLLDSVGTFPARELIRGWLKAGVVERGRFACVVNALEPEWEARFEPRSYGFRPGRGCQDAITAIYWTVNGRTPKRLWVLDADLAAAFDRLDHDHILASLGTFPARELIKRWLKAGVVERGWFRPTERGTPQGGPASPVLLNVALHGMENAAGVRYRPTGSQGLGTEPGCPAVIRYADDRAPRARLEVAM